MTAEHVAIEERKESFNQLELKKEKKFSINWNCSRTTRPIRTNERDVTLWRQTTTTCPDNLPTCPCHSDHIDYHSGDDDSDDDIDKSNTASDIWSVLRFAQLRRWFCLCGSELTESTIDALTFASSSISISIFVEWH